MFRKASHMALAAIILACSASTPALAHTSVVKTIPSYKSTLSEMPETISIEFTDILMTLGEKKVNSIEVTDPSGTLIPLIGTEIDKSVLSVSLPQRSYLDGTYLVSYRVVSADGHSISGSYELYLNTPSENVAVVEEHEGFFHIHQTHIIQGGIALIFILLWWAYRRFNREQGL
jgi:methionine-rich copper-binding protein CopC